MSNGTFLWTADTISSSGATQYSGYSVSSFPIGTTGSYVEPGWVALHYFGGKFVDINPYTGSLFLSAQVREWG